MTTRKSKTGRALTDDELDAIAAEVETADYAHKSSRPVAGAVPQWVSALPMWSQYASIRS